MMILLACCPWLHAEKMMFSVFVIADRSESPRFQDLMTRHHPNFQTTSNSTDVHTLDIFSSNMHYSTVDTDFLDK